MKKKSGREREREREREEERGKILDPDEDLRNQKSRTEFFDIADLEDELADPEKGSESEERQGRSEERKREDEDSEEYLRAEKGAAMLARKYGGKKEERRLIRIRFVSNSSPGEKKETREKREEEEKRILNERLGLREEEELPPFLRETVSCLAAFASPEYLEFIQIGVKEEGHRSEILEIEYREEKGKGRRFEETDRGFLVGSEGGVDDAERIALLLLAIIDNSLGGLSREKIREEIIIPLGKKFRNGSDLEELIEVRRSLSRGNREEDDVGMRDFTYQGEVRKLFREVKEGGKGKKGKGKGKGKDRSKEKEEGGPGLLGKGGA